MAKLSRSQRRAAARQEAIEREAELLAPVSIPKPDGGIEVGSVIQIYDPISKQTRPVRVQADTRRDNIVANFNTLLNALISLPHAFDDLSRTFGVGVYSRMMKDGEVFASVGVLTLAATANEPNVVVSVRPSHPQYEIASEIARACMTGVVESTETPFMQILEQACDFIWQGSSVCRITKIDDFEFPLEDFPVMKRLMARRGDRFVRRIEDISKKPLEATSFVVDRKPRIVGILPVIRNGAIHPYSSMIPLSTAGPGNKPQDLREVEPRSAYLILTWDAQSGDPRGRSLLESAYTAWWTKVQAWSDWMAYVSQFAKPSIWATPPEAAEEVCINGKTITPTEALAEALAQFQGASYGAFAAGTKLQKIEMNTAGAVFSELISFANREIIRAILNQNLATSEGAHMSRAAAETHQDVLSLRIMQIKNLICERVRRDVFTQFVVDNYGYEYRHLTPKLDLGLGDGFPISIEGVATLVKAGWTPDETQWAVLERQFGLPVRQYMAVAKRIKKRMAGAAGDATDADAGTEPDDQNEDAADTTDNNADASKNNGGNNGEGENNK